MPVQLAWVAFTPENESLFRETLECTYIQTLDCPELTGIRAVKDVLADHRAAGEFNPSWWWVGMSRGVPVGVLLLSRLVDRPAVEILYLGVSQVARGTGVADALLERALACARQESATELTLAVDVRNLPARRLYARWRFVQTAVREAWIATLAEERG